MGRKKANSKNLEKKKSEKWEEIISKKDVPESLIPDFFDDEDLSDWTWELTSRREK